MAAHLVQLKSRHDIAAATMAFHLEKPAGFSFKAGQSVDLTLVDPPETDGEGNTRAFSLASAPYEDDLIVATRLRNTAFKRVFRSVPLGTEVKIDGPFGNMTLHNNASKPAVFLTGGIGITPFRSIVLQAAREKRPHRLLLFYSNHRPEDAAFLAELEHAGKDNLNYKMIGTMTRLAASDHGWKGEVGHIQRGMLENVVPDLMAPVYYVAGPPVMVAAMHTMLNESGVDDDNIRIEEFSGY